MNPDPQSIANRPGYDLWSAGYDTDPNPTVATDEARFPALWSGVRGRRVLEVGCGTGRHTLRLASQGNRVTGLDQSPGMLAMARQKLAGFPEVALREADFLSAPPLGDPAFDVLVVALVLEHIADLPAFFAAARRQLVSGGELYASELHPSRAARGTQAHFTGADGTRFNLQSIAHPEGCIEAAAAAAGFRLRIQQDALGDAALAASRPGWDRYLGVPMIRMWAWTAGAA